SEAHVQTEVDRAQRRILSEVPRQLRVGPLQLLRPGQKIEATHVQSGGIERAESRDEAGRQAVAGLRGLEASEGCVVQEEGRAPRLPGARPRHRAVRIA